MYLAWLKTEFTSAFQMSREIAKAICHLSGHKTSRHVKGTSFYRDGRNWAWILVPLPSSHMGSNRVSTPLSLSFFICKIGLMTDLTELRTQLDKNVKGLGLQCPLLPLLFGGSVVTPRVGTRRETSHSGRSPSPQGSQGNEMWP